jgi:hypothetical protein
MILIFITGQKELAQQNRRVQIGRVGRHRVARITSLWNNWVFGGGSTNFRDMNWMRIMDYCLISPIAIQDMDKQSSRTIHRF